MIRLLTLAACALLLGAAEPPPAAATAGEATPITVGTTMPTATLLTVEGKPVELASTWAVKPVVIIVYRGSWCPFCSRHLAALGGLAGELTAAGWELVAIAPDRPALLTPPKPDGIRRLSDQDALLLRALGLAFTLDAATREKYQGYGIDLEKASGRDHHILPVPAVILVDTTGTVRFIHTDPDYKERLDPAKVLEAAKAVAAAK